MRCHTEGKPGYGMCTGTPTHMLLYSIPDMSAPGDRKHFRQPTCEPCGQEYLRLHRHATQSRIVRLHVHMPPSAFTEIIEGHRLVKDAEHEARCFDCGTTGSPTWFQFQTNGCRARPESITVLRNSREMLASYDRPQKAARMWWRYAVDYLGMHVEDWREVDDHAQYGALFTFRDREYGVRYELLGGRIGAEKLPNRGRPAPQLIDGELDPYNQAVFTFHNRVTDSGSMYFATWTPGHTNIPDRELIILYTPEGAITEALRVPGLWGWAETTGAICDAFGPISSIKLQTRIYE